MLKMRFLSWFFIYLKAGMHTCLSF